jgi:hypothetical protein
MHPDEQFDLDVQFHGMAGAFSDGPEHPFPLTDMKAMAETEAPEATCPADTCGIDCLTQTCADATCGCNTSETCDQRLCPGDAITFGYCEDQSDDSCDACKPPGSDGCPDPPDCENNSKG